MIKNKHNNKQYNRRYQSNYDQNIFDGFNGTSTLTNYLSNTNQNSWTNIAKNAKIPSINVGTSTGLFSKIGNVGSGMSSGLQSGIGAAGTFIGQGAQSLISNGLSSGAGNAIGSIGGTVGGIVGNFNPVLGGIISAGTGIIGGGINALFGSKINQEKVNEITNTNNSLNKTNISSTDNSSLLSDYNSINWGSDFSKRDIGKDGLFSHKARNKYNELKQQYADAQNQATMTFNNAANTVDVQNDRTALTNYAALGGRLNMNNGIIKGAQKALNPFYTKYNVLQQVGNKADAINDAFNFMGTMNNKRAFGGDLSTNGGDFSNGIIDIQNGGSHEENPYEGIQVGIDNQGTPNLVEEGEIIYNDYVYSNRMKASKQLLQKNNLPKSYANKSFSDIARSIGQDSQDNPNDHILKNSLNVYMQRLQDAQETVRQQKQLSQFKKLPKDQQAQILAQAQSQAQQEQQQPQEEQPQEEQQFACGGKLHSCGGKLYKNGGSKKIKPFIPYGGFKSTKDNDSLQELFYKTYNKNNSNNNILGFKNNNNVRKVIGIAPVTSVLQQDIDNYYSQQAEGSRKVKQYINNSNNKDLQPTWMRYAPVVGQGLSVFSDAMGWTNKPDYTNADRIEQSVNGLRNVNFTPVGNYESYSPFDRNYYINKLNAQTNATRRGILNTSGSNRAVAIGSMLANDYNAQNSLGNIARQAEEYNFANRNQVDTFNRATDMYNSEGSMKAQEANRQNDSLRFNAILNAAQLRQNIKNQADQNRSANLSNFINSIGSIGRENYARNMITSNNALYYKPTTIGGQQYKQNAFGGLLNINTKNKRR